MKKFLLLITLLLFSVAMFSQTKQRESYYQDKFAKIVGGETEVVLSDGTRADIVTKNYAIEVDFADKWAESIGQALNYGRLLNKEAGILLVVKGREEDRHIEKLVNNIAYYRLPIKVWIWDYVGNTWGVLDYKFEYKVTFLY